jgi:hypothetical protein
VVDLAVGVQVAQVVLADDGDPLLAEVLGDHGRLVGGLAADLCGEVGGDLSEDSVFAQV